MADAKISALTALTGANVASDDPLPIVDTSVTTTKKINASELKTYMSASPTLVTPNIGVATGTSLDVSGVLESGANGGTGGQLKMFGSTSGDVTVKPAAAAGTATAFTLPATNGTNTYALTTNGSGVTSWSQIGLTTAVTGILPVANGGTGLSSFTSTDVPYASSASALTSTSNIKSNGTNIGINKAPVSTYALDVSGLTRTGFNFLEGVYTPGDTTPSVSGISYLSISNSSPTTITNFDDAVVGQMLILRFEDSNTTITRANAYLAGGVNFTSTQYDILVLFRGNFWVEMCRSVNS